MTSTPQTVDALLDLYERELGSVSPSTCVPTCMAVTPKCVIIPEGHCRAACESECVGKLTLQHMVAEFVSHRVADEHEAALLADSALNRADYSSDDVNDGSGAVSSGKPGSGLRGRRVSLARLATVTELRLRLDSAAAPLRRSVLSGSVAL